jgi:hypothetical protein
LAFIQQGYELLGLAVFVKMHNLEKAPEHVHNAQFEKIFLRVQLAIEDLTERMEKHGLFERFSSD